MKNQRSEVGGQRSEPQSRSSQRSVRRMGRDDLRKCCIGVGDWAVGRRRIGEGKTSDLSPGMRPPSHLQGRDRTNATSPRNGGRLRQGSEVSGQQSLRGQSLRSAELQRSVLRKDETASLRFRNRVATFQRRINP